MICVCFLTRFCLVIMVYILFGKGSDNCRDIILYNLCYYYYIIKQLVSRHNVNRTKNCTEESQAQIFADCLWSVQDFWRSSSSLRPSSSGPLWTSIGRRPPFSRRISSELWPAWASPSSSTLSTAIRNQSADSSASKSLCSPIASLPPSN